MKNAKQFVDEDYVISTDNVAREADIKTIQDDAREGMIELTVTERKLIDHALCFLNANWEEDNEESLGMNESAFSRHLKVIQSKLYPKKGKK